MSSTPIHQTFLERHPDPDLVTSVQGPYDYHHYVRDGVDDRGWGCGYRTLQTLISWIIKNKKSSSKETLNDVPSILKMQETILSLDETKSKQFVGSKDWIGCYEMFLVLDGLFDVPCKLVHCQSGSDLENHVDEIIHHLQQRGSPIPIGGDQDCSSKAIFGVKRNSEGDVAFLVVDPHFVADDRIKGVGHRRTDQLSNEKNNAAAIATNFVRWMKLDDFQQSSFYNLCFPMV